ncbi:MAG: IS200/IS605 family transposase [Pirellulales bacterium]
MSQSLAKNLLHLIFSTKGRTPWISVAVRSDLNAYLAGILRQWDSPALTVGSVADHVHVLFLLSKNRTLCRIVEEVKKGSSKWLKSKAPSLAGFHWQAGYGAFSVSQSNVKNVTHYIENQEEHHRTVSFQDEFRAFLKRHGIDYDEEQVWD